MALPVLLAVFAVGTVPALFLRRPTFAAFDHLQVDSGFPAMPSSEERAGVRAALQASANEVVAAIITAYPRCSRPLAYEIWRLARHLGTSWRWLANLIRFESAGTFSADVRNPSPQTQATGVLQITASTARGLGTTVDALALMTAHDQLRIWGTRYFDGIRGQALPPLDTEQKLYMAIFQPVAMAWQPSRVFSEAARDENEGIDTPQDYIDFVNRQAEL